MMGTLVVCIWRLMFRRRSAWMDRQCRRRGAHSCHTKPAQRETAVAAEKASLIENQDEDVPDLPAYTEADEKAALS